MPQFQITEEQKQKIVSIVVSGLISMLLAIAAVFGFNLIVVQPEQRIQDARMEQLKNLLGFDDLPAPGEIGAQSLGGGLVCKSGSGFCLKSLYGRDLLGYSDGGTTLKWKIEGTDGTFSHTGFDVLIAPTNITVTNGASFTPTGKIQNITAAGPVTPTLSITDTNGAEFANNTELILVNLSNQTINLADSGNVNIAGAWAGGQWDILDLIYKVTAHQWIEVTRSNN